MINSVLLPAHAITSGMAFPVGLAGVWRARYADRAASFTLTIGTDGAAMLLQVLPAFGGIPIFRTDTLGLVSVVGSQAEWQSNRTRIVVSFDPAFTLLEGTETILSRTPARFTATRN